MKTMRTSLSALVVMLVVGLTMPAVASANWADDIVVYTNRVRAAYGLPALYVNDSLSDAALYHARNMAYQHCYGHVLDGYGPGDRMHAFGYDWTTYAENVAWNRGYRYPAYEAMRWWINSPGHFQNILNPNVTEIGVGIAQGRNGTYFYCQLFGSR